jgi:hypothetical protein
VLWLVDVSACDIRCRCVKCRVQVGVVLKGARACEGWCVQLRVVLGADERGDWWVQAGVCGGVC